MHFRYPRSPVQLMPASILPTTSIQQKAEWPLYHLGPSQEGYDLRCGTGTWPSPWHGMLPEHKRSVFRIPIQPDVTLLHQQLKMWLWMHFPVPTITGPANACVNSTNNILYTESGMTGYTWTISGGGMIPLVREQMPSPWHGMLPGTNDQCFRIPIQPDVTLLQPTVKNVTVMHFRYPRSPVQLMPASILPTTSIQTESGMTGYTWTISGGGMITAVREQMPSLSPGI